MNVKPQAMVATALAITVAGIMFVMFSPWVSNWPVTTLFARLFLAVVVGYLSLILASPRY